MKMKFLIMLIIYAFVTTSSQAALTGFSDDFSNGLDNSIFSDNSSVNADGHIGASGGYYQMTDAAGGNSAEIYKSYWTESDTSGSFDASVKFQVLLPGGEQSDVKWTFKGKDADNGDWIEIKMFTPTKRIKITQRTGGSFYTLLNDTDIGYNSGDDLTLGLTYQSSSSNIIVTAQVNDDTEQELYNGTGNGDGVSNIIADRNSLSVGKWGDASSAQATLSVDEWSLVVGDNSGGGNGDGTGGGNGDGTGGGNGDGNSSSFSLAFSDDFSANSLDGSIFTINSDQNADGHVGIGNGVYQMTDAAGDSSAEIYKSYWNESDTSGSFEASLKYSAILPGDEQSDIKWTFKGKDADNGDQIEIKMFTPSKKIKVSYKASGQNWVDLINDTDVGYSSGDDLSLGLIYNESAGSITVTAQVNSGDSQELYSGTGTGNSIANIIGDRNSVLLTKWGNNNPDSKPILNIDEWSIQSYTPIEYPANWGDSDNDGINDSIEALFGGDSSDPDDFLTVFAAVTNALNNAGGLTLPEALQATEDARANSMSVSVDNGSATIQLSMESSTNLVDWSSSTNLNVTMPVNANSQFFRFSFE